MSNAYQTNAYRTSSQPRRSSSRRPPLYPVPARVSPVFQVHPSSSSAPIPFPRGRSGATVRRLPVLRPMPLWLRWLIRLQRGSLVVVFLLAIATLIAYGGSVYTQHRWSREYRKLKILQRSEREITAAGETMRNYIAKQAERPGAGLVTKTPDNTIFLQPAPRRQEPAIKPPQPPVETRTQKPLGY